MEYNIVNKDGIKFIVFKTLEEIPFIRHGFSTKIGGISKGGYSYLNLGFKTGDGQNNVKENIKRFALAVGLNYENLVISDQIHGDDIKVIRNEDKGKGYLKQRDYSGVDGLVTNVPNIPLMAIFADCVPIFFVDTVKKIIGICHAGWKGTKLRIGKKTVQTMINMYSSKPDEIVAVIGPSIGKCCYEVDDVVVGQFNKNFTNISNFIFSKGKGKYQLDLCEANRIVLNEIGIPNKNIVISNLCTGCNLDLFYSYRKDKGNTGRMGAIIQLI